MSPRTCDVFDFDRPRLSFAADLEEAGRKWIASLPRTVERLASGWNIEVEGGRPGYGYNAFVLPAGREHQRLVLKLVWPPEASVVEAFALRAWRGRGAVLLFEADTSKGALLLERLDENRSLSSLPLLEAAASAGSLLRRLAIPAPEGFESTTETAAHRLAVEDQGSKHADPVPEHFLDRASTAARRLVTSGERSLVHADLHFDNVLAGDREDWLAIDPRPLDGDPEIAVAELMWARLDEARDQAAVIELFDVLIESGRLDRERATDWAILRCVDYWRWGVEHGLTDDPRRCARILEALTSSSNT